MDEPLLEASDIQGHILPRYAGSDVRLLAVRAADASALRELLTRLSPLTSMRDAMLVRAQRKRFLMSSGRAQSPEDALRINVAFTRSGLDLLGATERGVDAAFDLGMNGVSTGDPKNRTQSDGTPEPAHPSHWKVGAPHRPFHAFVILAAVQDVRERTSPLARQIVESSGIELVYDEFGEDLPDSIEHFGFADGISSPGILGEFEAAGERSHVTTRYGVPSRDGIEFGKPGQPLIWPGRVLVGMPRSGGDVPAASPLYRNGSFLVFRRLQQDVGAFYADTDALAIALGAQLSLPLDGTRLREVIVGRRQNGQPLMRDGAGPDGHFELNYFGYANAAPDLTLADGSVVRGAARDLTGARCPFWAHIRKVNPRDGANDLAEDAHNLQVLRRGVPFGPAYDHSQPSAAINRQERGLLFMSYQRNISSQFLALNSHWMNQFEVPAGTGHDLLVGLTQDATGRCAPRRADWPGTSLQFSTPARPWVIATGGAYLFAPSRSAVAALASGNV